MEPGENGNFKHIPFRCYQGDLPFSQCLVKPVKNEGNSNTLQNLLENVYNNIAVEKCKFYLLALHYSLFK